MLAARAVDGLVHRASRTANTSCPSHAGVGDVVRRAALVDVLDGRRALERRAHAVPVVLDHVDDGQLPEAGHVERLVEGAGVHDRLAHEADAHLIAAAVLDGEADAGGERDVPADDAVAAEEVHAAVEHVHRAALAVRAAVDAAEQLGHHGARRDAAHERLAVVAVRGDDVVVGPQRGLRARAHGFLSDVQVAEAADLAQRVRLGGAFLEAALEQHVVQQLQVQRGIGLRIGFLLGGHFSGATRSSWQRSCHRARRAHRNCKCKWNGKCDDDYNSNYNCLGL